MPVGIVARIISDTGLLGISVPHCVQRITVIGFR